MGTEPNLSTESKEMRMLILPAASGVLAASRSRSILSLVRSSTARRESASMNDGVEISVAEAAQYSVRRSLPLNQPVELTLTSMKSGNIRFTCAMHMVSRAITAE